MINLPLKIARRYLFAKKSTNVINVISGISVFGIILGTAALILILSVFNGFEDLIMGLYNSFNPDAKITLVEGKVFHPDEKKLAQLRDLDEVTYVSTNVEEIAFFEYQGGQDFGIIKGVDEYYNAVTHLDSALIRGVYALDDTTRNYAVVGAGMEYKLSMNIDDPLTSLNIYMPKRKQKAGALNNAFKKRFVYPAGTFSIQQDFDQQYIICSLPFAQDLLSYTDEISAIEVKLKEGKEAVAIEKIKAIMGDKFEIKNRYQQNEAFFKLMKVEKWIGFAVLLFVIVLIAFNMVGSLWMVVIDKKKDIAILKYMGATDSMIRRIFFYQGLMMTFIGVAVGFILALILYVLQKCIGLVKISEGAGLLVNSYPISLRCWDLVVVFLGVMLIGGLVSYGASRLATRENTILREE